MMICPKCKVEYQEGFTECTDCGEQLVSSEETKYLLSSSGIGLIKFGLSLLFITFFEIIILALTEHMFQINSLVIIIIMIEFFISIGVIIWGNKQKVEIEQ